MPTALVDQWNWKIAKAAKQPKIGDNGYELLFMLSWSPQSGSQKFKNGEFDSESANNIIKSP